MRASLKKERFSFKKCEGEKAQQSWEDTAAKKIMTRMGSEIKTKGKEETKRGSSKTQIKQMFIIEVVIDN